MLSTVSLSKDEGGVFVDRHDGCVTTPQAQVGDRCVRVRHLGHSLLRKTLSGVVLIAAKWRIPAAAAAKADRTQPVLRSLVTRLHYK